VTTTTRRALLSVYDKAGLLPFAEGLAALGFELIASGGTARALVEAGLAVTEVSDLTGYPELLGGRVKTLHPAVHGGILSRRTPEDAAELAEHGLGAIDLVACNLYPFEATVARPGVTEAEAVEEIDIGGVTLLRAAAKACAHVTVAPEPAAYPEVLAALRGGEGDALRALRRRLAARAFAQTARYDRAIAAWMAGAEAPAPGVASPRLELAFERVAGLRYGENPHQAAALFAPAGLGPGFEQLGGAKELSYNNLLDMDAARGLVADFDRPTVAIIKHTNPCGVASGDHLPAAFAAALASDPVSAFGSIIAVNRPVEADLVEALGKLFVEVLVAPDFSDEALARLAATRRGCRVVRAPVVAPPGPALRPITGGLLAQEPDHLPVDRAAWQVVTRRPPTVEELAALAFAWRVAKHVRSNAIVLARGEATVGVGAGQMSRVDAVHLAARRAGPRASGAALASDAFFPFPDGLELAADAGVKAVAQPGGSMRDAEVIAAADARGVAMVLTGVRHFRH